MDFVRVGSNVLHARRDGDPAAPVLVLASPLGADLRLWERVAAYLEDRCFVVRYDQRGHGLSTLRDDAWGLDDLADDLAGLLDQLDTGPGLICGLGLGGLTALALLRRRPDLAAGLCLIGTDIDPAMARAVRAAPELAEPDGLTRLAEHVLEQWFTQPFREQRSHEVLGWRTMLERTPITAYRQGLEAIADASFELAPPQIPMLCLTGAAEPDRRRRGARELADQLGCSAVQEVAGAAHLVPVTHAAQVAAALLGLVERVYPR